MIAGSVVKKRLDWNGFFSFGAGGRQAKACRRIKGRMAGDAVERERARGLAARSVAPRGRRTVLRSSIVG